MPRRTGSGVQKIRSDLPANREHVRGRRRRNQIAGEVFGLARPLTHDSQEKVHEAVDLALPSVNDILAINGYIFPDEDGVLECIIDRRVVLCCTILERLKLRNSLSGVAGVFEMGKAIGRIEKGLPDKDYEITAEIEGLRWLGKGEQTLALMLKPHEVLEEEAKVTHDILKEEGAKIKNRFIGHVALFGLTKFVKSRVKKEVKKVVTENLEDVCVQEIDMQATIFRKSGEYHD